MIFCSLPLEGPRHREPAGATLPPGAENIKSSRRTPKVIPPSEPRLLKPSSCVPRHSFKRYQFRFTLMLTHTVCGNGIMAEVNVIFAVS